MHWGRGWNDLYFHPNKVLRFLGFRTIQYHLAVTLTQQKLEGVHSDTTNQNIPPYTQILEPLTEMFRWIPNVYDVT